MGAIKSKAGLGFKSGIKSKTNTLAGPADNTATNPAGGTKSCPQSGTAGRVAAWLRAAGGFIKELAAGCSKPNSNCIIYYLLPVLIIALLSACGDQGGSSGKSPASSPAAPAPVPLWLSTAADTDGDGINNAYDTEYLREDVYVHGTGTTVDPYVITNIYQLQAIAGVDHTGVPLDESNYTGGNWLFGPNKQAQLNASYVLQGEIDAGVTRQWNSVSVNGTTIADGFTPIGQYEWSPNYVEGTGDLFNGRFSGVAFEITGLYINRRYSPRLGLFGAVGADGVVALVSLVDARIRGSGSVAGLAGVNYGRIYNSQAGGDFAGTGFLAALVGENHGLVSSSSGSGAVSGKNAIGGLVGTNYGEIEYSYAAVNVIGDNAVGGLAGSNSGSIVSSHSRSGVSGSTNVGGLVGEGYDGTVSDSYSSGLVVGLDNVGGLLGTSRAGSFVAFSNSVAFVFAATRGGGLIGDNQGEVFASHAESEVTGTNEIGGLAGHSNGTISASYSLGRALGNNTVGGLVGLAAANITSSYSRAEVSGKDNVGGLVGVYRGAANASAGIYSSYALADISVADGGKIGGLVASNQQGIISASYWQAVNISGAPGQVADAGTQVSQQQLQRCRTATEEEDKVLCVELFPDGAWGKELSRGGSNVVWDFSDPSAPPALLVLSREADKELPITQCRFAPPAAKKEERGRERVCNINLARTQLRAGAVFARLTPPSDDVQQEFVYRLTGIQTDLFYLDKELLIFARDLDEKDARHYEFGARASLASADGKEAGSYTQQIKLTVIDR